MSFIFILPFFSFAMLAGAWYFELVLGLDPCPLCLTQRLPHYMAVVLGLIYFFYRRDKQTFFFIFFLLFIYSTGLAAYHAGAEYGFWAGPSTCAGAKPIAASAVDLLKSIEATKIIDCTAVQWRLFGLSLAGYNAVISAILAAMALILDPNRDNPSNFHANN